MARPLSPERRGDLLHPGFIGSGATLLIAACATDAMYVHTALQQWANFSAWLITAGLILALIATILLVIDFVVGRAGRISWIPFVLVALAAVLSLLNAFVHSRDAWTSVVPEGMWLSAAVTILLLIVGFWGWRVTTSRGQPTGERP